MLCISAASRTCLILDGAFDVVITGCLLPHIGVVGDTVTLRPGWEAQRAATAAELLRVTRPGGSIIVGNPNRLCPADLFHKGQMTGPYKLVRWHWPSERFLLSHGDYVRLFGASATLSTLPISGYWGFHSKEQRPFTRLLARALKAYFTSCHCRRSVRCGARGSTLGLWCSR